MGPGVGGGGAKLAHRAFPVARDILSEQTSGSSRTGAQILPCTFCKAAV